jgi:hypothetical protein
MAEPSRQEQSVHALVERLAPSQLSALRGLLETMLEPIDRTIAAAQLEEQEVTPKTAKELDRAKRYNPTCMSDPQRTVAWAPEARDQLRAVNRKIALAILSAVRRGTSCVCVRATTGFSLTN